MRRGRAVRARRVRLPADCQRSRGGVLGSGARPPERGTGSFPGELRQPGQPGRPGAGSLRPPLCHRDELRRARVGRGVFGASRGAPRRVPVAVPQRRRGKAARTASRGWSEQRWPVRGTSVAVFDLPGQHGVRHPPRLAPSPPRQSLPARSRPRQGPVRDQQAPGSDAEDGTATPRSRAAARISRYCRLPA